jgi:PKD repeat protein
MKLSSDFGINSLLLLGRGETKTYGCQMSMLPLVMLFACGMLYGAQNDGLSVSESTSLPLDGCTVGVASGQVTVDGRPIMWKVRDWHGRQQLVYDPGSLYGYVAIRSEGEGYPAAGLSSSAVATGNSLVGTGGDNFTVMHDILSKYASLDQVSQYWWSHSIATGCFPVIDGQGNAVMFEGSLSDWRGEYDSMDPDREAQGLHGLVVRANEFHRKTEGTDNQSIGGRYASGTYNILGLIGLNNLSVQTLIQGNEGPNKGYEFVRYGPGRALAAISTDGNVSTMVVHGVAPGEDPALSTMWIIPGQSNYGIAVPVWVRVPDIPQALATGEMYDRITSIFGKKNEAVTQASVFPVEAHMFDVVTNTLLSHWRTNGVASVAEMTRIEHQMANDAYSLLDCLDRRQSNNRAPTLDLLATPDGLRLNASVNADDSDGRIIQTIWDFGDGEYATEKSPVHAYAKLGTYLVSCTVTDDDGVSITQYKYFSVPVVTDLAGDDGIVNLLDFAQLTAHWLNRGCCEPNSYDVADFDHSGVVDLVDMLILAESWLKDVHPVVPPEPGLIAHWRLDETEGTVAHDSARDKDGTLSGNPVWQPQSGKVAGALQVDGVDDYVTTPFILNPAAGPFSVFAWVKGGAPGQVILSQTGSANWLGADPVDGRLMTEALIGARFGRPLLSQTVITGGDWRRVGLTWDGKKTTLYVDDVEVAKDTQSPVTPSDGGLQIGAGKGLEAGSFFSGLIDDVRIYNRAVTP